MLAASSCPVVVDWQCSGRTPACRSVDNNNGLMATSSVHEEELALTVMSMAHTKRLDHARRR